MQKGNFDHSLLDQQASWEYALSKTQAMSQHRERMRPQQPQQQQLMPQHLPPTNVDGQENTLAYGHGWGPRASWTASATALPVTSTDGYVDGQRVGMPAEASSRSNWQPMHRTTTVGPSRSSHAGQQVARDSPAGPARAHLARSLSLVSLRGIAGGRGDAPAAAAEPTHATSATRARSASLGRKGKKGPEKVTWDILQVALQRVPRYGFGIAVAGGRDAPHFTSGDPSIVVSDVIKGGPAEGKLLINDRVVSVNGASLENVDHATAIALLKDGGNIVSLLVKRKAVDRPHRDTPQPNQALVPTASAASTAAALGKVTLVKKSRRDEFGIVFGFKLYVKALPIGSLAARSGLIHEGDVVMKINNVSSDMLSLAEAAKLVEKASGRGVGEKLSLHIQRGPAASDDAPASAVRRSMSLSSLHRPPGGESKGDGLRRNNHSPPPVDLVGRQADSRNDFHAAHQKPEYEKAGIPSYGTIGSSQAGGLQFESEMAQHDRGSQGPAAPLETRAADFGQAGSARRPGGLTSQPEQPSQASSSFETQLQDGQMHLKTNLAPRIAGAHLVPAPECRTAGRRVSYYKDSKGPGIGLVGGNATGIFISMVLAGSQADTQGLKEGDQILEVNDWCIQGMTREEVYMAFDACRDLIRITVKPAPSKNEYLRLVDSGGAGDLFYVRAHFKYSGGSRHMGFQPGDLLRITDTLAFGDPGEWKAEKLELHCGTGGQVKSVASGLVPSARRAQDLLSAHDHPQDDEDDELLAPSRPSAPSGESSLSKASIGGLFKRRGGPAKEKHSSKSHFEDVILGTAPDRFQAYEQVSLQKPGFARPLVVYGCLADVARDLLCRHYPDRYERPQSTASGAIHLSAVHDAMSRGKHCTLVAGPGGLRRLVRSHYTPIVILLRADSQASAKEVRERFAHGRMPPRKVAASEPYERGLEVESACAHLLSATVPVWTRDSEHDWVERLQATVARLQHTELVWTATGRPVPGSESSTQDWPVVARNSSTALAEDARQEAGGHDPVVAGGSSRVQGLVPEAASMAVVSVEPAAAVECGAADRQEQPGSQRSASSTRSSVTKPNEGAYEQCSAFSTSGCTSNSGGSRAGAGGGVGSRMELQAKGKSAAAAAALQQFGQDLQPQAAGPGKSGPSCRMDEGGEPHGLLYGPKASQPTSADEAGRPLYDSRITRLPTGSLVLKKTSDYATISRLRATASSRPLSDGQHMNLTGEHTSQSTREGAEPDFILPAERYRDQFTSAQSVHEPVMSQGRNWEAGHRVWPESKRTGTQATSQWSAESVGGQRSSDIYESSANYGHSAEHDRGRTYGAPDRQQHQLSGQCTLSVQSRSLASSVQSQINPDNFWLNHNSFDSGSDATLYHAVPLIVSDIKGDFSSGGSSSAKHQEYETYARNSVGETLVMPRTSGIVNPSNKTASGTNEEAIGRRKALSFNAESTIKSSL